jgi:hypothetical protein
MVLNMRFLPPVGSGGRFIFNQHAIIHPIPARLIKENKGFGVESSEIWHKRGRL